MSVAEEFLTGSSGQVDVPVDLDQDDFPERWSCDSNDKSVKVEVRVPTLDREVASPTGLSGEAAEEGIDREAALEDLDVVYTWIEIPTTEVEQYVEKGDAAQIQRTAKVRFPTEWGNNTSDVLHNSPRRLVEGFSGTDSRPFQLARISFYDDRDGWVLEHVGWLGGIGPASEPSLHKFWVYDFVEMFSSVGVDVTFDHPSVRQAVERIGTLIRNNTQIPLVEAIIRPPNTEEEFEVVADRFDIAEIESDGLSNAPGTPGATNPYDDPPDTPQSAEELAEDESLESYTIDTTTSRTFWFDGSAKTFSSNHDTIADVKEWFENKSGAKLHFEPHPNGVRLLADIYPTRRTFSQTEVIQQGIERDGEYQYYAATDVLWNDALFEMKPVNTLRLNGAIRETGGGFWDDAADFITTFDLDSDVSREYPHVTVQVPALLQAAEGVELAPELVESDSTSLDEAEEEAIAELRQLLEEPSEGEIILEGEPRLQPFEKVEAFEVCGERIEYEQQPVQYEVESVKHVKEATDIYKTEVSVSLWANEDNIETVEKEYVSV